MIYVSLGHRLSLVWWHITLLTKMIIKNIIRKGGDELKGQCDQTVVSITESDEEIDYLTMLILYSISLSYYAP